MPWPVMIAAFTAPLPADAAARLAREIFQAGMQSNLNQK
jgi:hypothetical protein